MKKKNFIILILCTLFVFNISAQIKTGSRTLWSSSAGIADIAKTLQGADTLTIQQWISNSVAETFETANKTIYIATTGSNVTGNGSVGAPYLTLLKALQSTKKVLNYNIAITYQFVAGSYNIYWPDIHNELRKFTFIERATMTFQGTMSQLTSGFTLAAQSPNTYVYNISGATWTANQYQDKFLLVGANYNPIAKNNTTTLNSFVGLAAGTSVWQHDVTINLAENRMTTVAGSFEALNNQINFKQLKFVFTTAGNIGGSNMSLNFQECTFQASTNFQNNSDKGIFTRCNFVMGAGTMTHWSVNSYYEDCMFRRTGSRSGAGLDFKNGYTKPQRGVYIINYATGIAFADGNFIWNQVGYECIIDATTAFTLRNNSIVQFTEEPVFLESTVTTLLNNVETMYGNYEFHILTMTGTPSSVYLGGGLSSFGYINQSKNITLIIPGIYAELESNSSATLTNNAATNIITGSILQNRSLTFDYEIKRGVGYRKGRFDILYDGSALIMGTDIFITDGDANVNASAIVFSTSISSNNILVTATLNNDVAATLKYNISRVMQ